MISTIRFRWRSWKGWSGSLKPGIVTDDDITKLSQFDLRKIAEYITSSWYVYPDGDPDRFLPLFRL